MANSFTWLNFSIAMHVKRHIFFPVQISFNTLFFPRKRFMQAGRQKSVVFFLFNNCTSTVNDLYIKMIRTKRKKSVQTTWCPCKWFACTAIDLIKHFALAEMPLFRMYAKMTKHIKNDIKTNVYCQSVAALYPLQFKPNDNYSNSTIVGIL